MPKVSCQDKIFDLDDCFDLSGLDFKSDPVAETQSATRIKVMPCIEQENCVGL
jgi:hypothetical protein